MLVKFYKWEIILSLFLLGGFLFQFFGQLNHDIHWYLISTERLLGGATFGHDIIEINPPLMSYLTLPVILFSKWTGISLPISYKIFIGCTIAISLLFGNHILKKLPQLSQRNRHLFICILGLFLTWGAGDSFGQREPLMLILTFPYFCLMALYLNGKTVGTNQKIVIAFIAAIGFSLKPFFLLPLIFMESYFLWKTRKLTSAFRIETFIMAIFFIAYLIAVYLFIPDYFTTIVPLGSLTYFAYKATFSSIFLTHNFIAILCFLLVFLITYKKSNLKIIMSPFILFIIGMIFSLFIQSKGFSYHFTPAFTMAGAVALFSTFSMMKKKEVLLGATCLLLLFIAGFKSNLYKPYSNNLHEEIQKQTLNLKPIKSMMSLSAHLWFSFPAVHKLNLTWCSRYPALWPIPGLIRLKSRKDKSSELIRQINWTEDYILNSVLEDFKKYNPDLVLIDKRKKKSYFDTILFDYVDFLSRKKEWKNLWQNYRRIPTNKGSRLMMVNDIELWARKELFKNQKGNSL